MKLGSRFRGNNGLSGAGMVSSPIRKFFPYPAGG
jgi:hypothetical protein